MKKCPTCQRTFDDDKRFCQSDGTPLVEADASSNPYATVVASLDEIASSIPPEETSSASSPPKDDDFLEIPDTSDSMKTSVVTEAEMREMAIESDLSGKSAPPFGSESKESDFSSQIPTPPKFNEPDLNPPKFGDSPYPPSDSPKSASRIDDFDFSTPKTESHSSSPIPSPFGEKMPPSYQTPSNSPFKDPEPPKSEPSSPFSEPSSPFGQTPFDDAEPRTPAQPERAPPHSPQNSFGEPAIGQNPPSSSAPPASAVQNKTLSTVSRVLGVLSIPCCGFIIFGIAA